MAFVDGYACPLAVQALCFRSGLNPSDWASWAQAIGSILAIVGAVGAVRHQHALHVATERANEYRDDADTLQSFLQLVDEALRRFEGVFEQTPSQEQLLEYFRSGLVEPTAAIKPSFRLVDGLFANRPWLALAFVTLRDGAFTASDAIESAWHLTYRPEGVGEFDRYRESLRGAIDCIIAQRIEFDCARQDILELLGQPDLRR